MLHTVNVIQIDKNFVVTRMVSFDGNVKENAEKAEAFFYKWATELGNQLDIDELIDEGCTYHGVNKDSVFLTWSTEC